jgi:hypothetical protein
MKTGNVNFQVVNEAFGIAEPPVGILFLGGICKRGPVNDPSTIITSQKQFRNIFGNIDIADDFPLLANRALGRGASLRVNRITDGSGVISESGLIGMGGLTGAVAEVGTISCVSSTSAGVVLAQRYFLISAGNGGTDYYFWFTGAIDPGIPGRVGVEIPLVGDKTAAEVATLVHDALEATGKFTCTVLSNVVTYTCVTAGITTNASAGNSGFTMNVTTQGVAGTPATALFQMFSKYPGADYNNLVMTISNASNQNADYFNLTMTLSNDSLVVEKYENLYIDGHPTDVTSTYLSKISINSVLVEPHYHDLSALQGQLRPANGVYLFDQGSDGGGVDLADYIGVQAAKSGYYSWDPFYDSYAVAYPAVSASDLDGIAAAGEAYAQMRKDLLYYQHLDNANVSASAYLSEKVTLSNINSPYIVNIGGGLVITHPISGIKVEISELGDILGNMAYVHKNFSIWSSFFGMQRGVIPGVLGVVNNFGSPALLADLDLLASNQINMVINRSGINMLWDDYTGQAAPSPENFACLMNLIFFIQKALKPTLESFLGEPTDFTLLKTIWFEVKPFLESLVTGRALSSFQWNGDQFATNFAQLVVNTPGDMQQGKIAIELKIVTIAPLKEISVKIILTKAGVTFEF